MGLGLCKELCSKADGQSPVRRLDLEAMVGSLAEEGPTDGRSSLQTLKRVFVM